MSDQYDVIVIGSGPGGYVAAARSAALGLKTAVVEKDKLLGGTCLHRGCIPTKALLHAADVMGEFKEAAKMGIVAEGVRVEWDKVQKHKAQVVKSNAGGVAHLMKGRKVDVYHGFGRLNGPGEVVVNADGEEKALKTSNVILATGSEPRALPFAKFDGERIMSSDHILNVESIPGSLVLIGGGVIGIEFASLFVRLGTKVTVLEAMDRIVAPCDADVSKELTRELGRQGCEIKTGVSVVGIENTGDAAQVTYEEDGKKKSIDAEICLVAIGRPPLTKNIGLETTRVKLDQRGFIETDDLFQTAEPGVYAIGDCINTPWLAHVAMAEGIRAAEHIAGESPAPLNYDHTPSCIYSDPPIAWCGLSEAEAKERGIEVKVTKYNFAANAKAAILGRKRGFIKFITDEKYGEIIGAHIIGPQATDLLAEPALAMQLEIPVEEVAMTVHAHPTLYESLWEVASKAAGRAIHG